jgi:uncharacterized protein YigE (DUF2233 family)
MMGGCGKRRGRDQPGFAILDRHYRGRRWFCLRLDLGRNPLQLFQLGDDGNPLRYFGELERHVSKQGRHVVAAMNAGMFEQDGSPVGWCVADGKLIKGPNQGEGQGNFFLKPNGIFAVQDGKALVRETDAAVKTVGTATLITQSGPLLVTAGQLHPAFRENSANRQIRNALGVDADGHVWLAISAEPVNFHESATLFRDELGCPDALFLDGVISQLHAPGLDHKGSAAALGPMLAVTEEVT